MTRATKPAATTVKTGRPKKADVDRKADLIRVRVTAEQRAMLAAAAARAGLDVSSWLRAIGIREAQKAVCVDG